MLGKHTDEGIKIRQLEDTIHRKDREIKEVKSSISDILLQIRNINESNDYEDPSVIRKKISELCTETRYQLLIDESEDTYKKAKIIELSTNRKVSK